MGQFAAETDSTYELREPQTLAALPLGPCLASGSAMSAIQASCPHRVFLRGLPVELADRSTLRNICSAFGDVEDAWVRVVDRTAGLHESWSFVQFATGAGASSTAEAGQDVWERVAQAQGLQIDASSINAMLLQPQKHVEGEVVAESVVLEALEAEDVDNFDFESFRERFSMWLGRPALRRDAEIIFKVLHEHRPDATVHGILRSVKDIDDDEVLAGTDILLVMAYSANYAPGAVCQRVNYEYSRKHGYGFKCEVLTKEDMLAAISPRDAFTWYKVLLLKRELSTENYKYVVWLDGDAAVLDHDKSLESFIHQAKGRHLILQEDLSAECRVNCGVMIFRRSNWASTLLRLLWEGNLSRRHHCKPYYEQSALVRLLVEAKELPARPSTARLQHPWHSDKVCLLPLRSLQTNRLREVQLIYPDKSFIFHPLFASEQFAEDKAQALCSVLASMGHSVRQGDMLSVSAQVTTQSTQCVDLSACEKRFQQCGITCSSIALLRCDLHCWSCLQMFRQSLWHERCSCMPSCAHGAWQDSQHLAHAAGWEAGANDAVPQWGK
eukprot:s1630_g7.t1